MNSKKLVLVTAGNRGIGAAIVKKLIDEKYRVVFTYNKGKERAEELVSLFNKDEKKCWCYSCDVSDIEQVKGLSKKVFDDHGVPYAIINNAGIVKDNLLLNMRLHEWIDVINVNLNSVFYMTHCYLNEMLGTGDGCIVNISSITGLRGNAGQANYAAAKAGQIGFTKSLAKEVGVFNIRVNCIAPGLVETDMIASLPRKLVGSIVKATPLRKMSQPEDVANMVAFLLGQDGRNITGQVMVVDGGLSI